MSNLDQTAIEHTYQNWAKVYEWLTPIYLLGNEKRLRQETIGSTGKLVGVDYTSDMLARAQERVEREGWKNVELIQGDAAHIELGRKFAAALSTLAISVIPDYRGALDRMQTRAKPGDWGC